MKRSNGYFALKSSKPNEKVANNPGRSRMNAIYSEVPHIFDILSCIGSLSFEI